MAGTNVLSQNWSPGMPNPSHGDARGREGETAQVSSQPRGLTGRAQGLLGAPTARTECAGAVEPPEGGASVSELI